MMYHGRTLILKVYPPGSFERKAVEEEIGKQELGIRNYEIAASLEYELLAMTIKE